ncbi:hypothetical protein MPTK1_7g11170 [Marchantia polymorpha subsp. ruderalis]|uniref:Uncharacterized protein n=2 Tax=Marchantia polymorpha TaxID=3197 RepID=A0AAF6BYB9_MARPO|nr:hypothetical protein MARPO_0003s0131 [Marchantia polymorpha]BBN17003.1 hypothetical protein Mp_7g11170 [Marchantia polymorpha subsp. ruderalis]|eukprot:PTQ49240.1 hypothetical protein MARPO_0003s0131 [Marchantia polymorpha]
MDANIRFGERWLLPGCRYRIWMYCADGILAHRRGRNDVKQRRSAWFDCFNGSSSCSVRELCRHMDDSSL